MFWKLIIIEAIFKNSVEEQMNWFFLACLSLFFSFLLLNFQTISLRYLTPHHILIISDSFCRWGMGRRQRVSPDFYPMKKIRIITIFNGMILGYFPVWVKQSLPSYFRSRLLTLNHRSTCVDMSSEVIREIVLECIGEQQGDRLEPEVLQYIVDILQKDDVQDILEGVPPFLIDSKVAQNEEEAKQASEQVLLSFIDYRFHIENSIIIMIIYCHIWWWLFI